MMQLDDLIGGGSKEVKRGLNSIGTKILEVCMRSEHVADQCFGSERVQGDENGA